MPRALATLLIEPLLLPFGVAVLVTVAGRLWLGARQAVPVLALAQVAAFLAAYVALLGLPSWPPEMAREQVAYVAAFGVLLGILLLLLPRWADGLQAAALAWPLAIVVWLALRVPLGLETILVAATLAVFGAAMIGPLAGARQRSPRRVLMLLSAVAGLAAVAAFGGSLAVAQLALALAASLAGVLLAGRTLALANAALIGPSGAALALAGTLALHGGASRGALLLLALVFAADRAARRLASRRYLWLERLLFAAGCLVPLGGALALARMGGGPLLP
jgi:hypothetical protein